MRLVCGMIGIQFLFYSAACVALRRYRNYSSRPQSAKHTEQRRNCHMINVWLYVFTWLSFYTKKTWKLYDGAQQRYISNSAACLSVCLPRPCAYLSAPTFINTNDVVCFLMHSKVLRLFIIKLIFKHKQTHRVEWMGAAMLWWECTWNFKFLKKKNS